MIKPFAIIKLGLIQGIFEAFPLSSSMHLRLLQESIENLDNMLSMHDIAALLHFGTALAFFAIMRGFIWRLLKGLHRKQYLKFNIIIISKLLCMITPTIIIGYCIKNMHFLGQYAIYYNLAAAFLMLLADFMPNKKSIISFNFITCIIIGISICLAFIPGVSRMGISYTTLRLFKMRRIDALTTTLLIGIPITLGASILTALTTIEGSIFTNHTLNLTIFSATLFSSIITYFCLLFTFKALRYWWIFSAYRIILSLILIIKTLI